MSQSAELRTAIENVQLSQGLYLVVDPKAPPEQLVPLFSVGGKIYAVRLDQELKPAGFFEGVRFVGPITPESKITN